MHYLQAIDATGTDDTAKVMAKMKATPINDFFTKNGHIREDGRMVHDMYLFEVKKPSESKGEWDLYKLLATIPADQAFRPLDKGGCPLVKTHWQAAAFVMTGLDPAMRRLICHAEKRGCPARRRA